MILGGIAAAICWVAWRRHNRLLDEQAEESGVELQPINPALTTRLHGSRQTGRWTTCDSMSNAISCWMMPWSPFSLARTCRLNLHILTMLAVNIVQLLPASRRRSSMTLHDNCWMFAPFGAAALPRRRNLDFFENGEEKRRKNRRKNWFFHASGEG